MLGQAVHRMPLCGCNLLEQDLHQLALFVRIMAKRDQLGGCWVILAIPRFVSDSGVFDGVEKDCFEGSQGLLSTEEVGRSMDRMPETDADSTRGPIDADEGLKGRMSKRDYSRLIIKLMVFQLILLSKLLDIIQRESVSGRRSSSSASSSSPSSH